MPSSLYTACTCPKIMYSCYFALRRFTLATCTTMLPMDKAKAKELYKLAADRDKNAKALLKEIEAKEKEETVRGQTKGGKEEEEEKEKRFT